MDAANRLVARTVFVLLAALLASCGGGGGGSGPATQTMPVTISPNTATVEAGSTQAFSASGGSGGYVFTVSSGIGSINAGGLYTAPQTTGSATITVSDSQGRSATSTVQIIAPAAPTAPTLSLSAGIKELHFTWTASTRAVTYRLLKNSDGASGFTQIGQDIPASARTQTIEISVHREDWMHALYVVSACNAGGCTDSQAQGASSLMLGTIGYFKPSNALAGGFGNAVALSADGTTLAVGAPLDNSVGNTINGPGTQGGGFMNGAAYVFRKSASGWALEAFIKSSNNGDQHRFGESLSLSGDGNTLVVGAPNENGGSTGVDGDKTNTNGTHSGAAYVFVRNGTQWTEQTYLKASNTVYPMSFGRSVSISRDGSTIAVGAPDESGGPGPNTASSGASYVYARSGNSWVVQAYVKASNPGVADNFGFSLSLSADGNTLVVGALFESSAASGVNGNEADDSLSQAGAAYLFTRLAGTWTQRAYLKASNPEAAAIFGYSVRVNDAGTRLAISAPFSSNQGAESGAVYVFDASNGAWAQQERLAATGSPPFFSTPGYGVSLAFDASGDQLIVGNENEQSAANGVEGDQSDDSTIGAGAAYLFARTNGGWQMQRYIKASNTGSGDFFGSSAACSADGATIALGARSESSSALNVGGDQTNNNDPVSGAAYLY
jgi:FG-GAP repeat protein